MKSEEEKNKEVEINERAITLEVDNNVINKVRRSPGRFPDPLIYNGGLLILKKPAIAF
jgi:hypothetical protein